jgi:hypothetical protein
MIDLHNSSASNRISAEIYDVTGRRVHAQIFGNVGVGDNTLRVSGHSSLKAGVYFVMVRVNGKLVQTGKVVKAEE